MGAAAWTHLPEAFVPLWFFTAHSKILFLGWGDLTTVVCWTRTWLLKTSTFTLFNNFDCKSWACWHAPNCSHAAEPSNSAFSPICESPARVRACSDRSKVGFTQLSSESSSRSTPSAVTDCLRHSASFPFICTPASQSSHVWVYSVLGSGLVLSCPGLWVYQDCRRTGEMNTQGRARTVPVPRYFLRTIGITSFSVLSQQEAN